MLMVDIIAVINIVVIVVSHGTGTNVRNIPSSDATNSGSSSCSSHGASRTSSDVEAAEVNAVEISVD